MFTATTFTLDACRYPDSADGLAKLIFVAYFKLVLGWLNKRELRGNTDLSAHEHRQIGSIRAVVVVGTGRVRPLAHVLHPVDGHFHVVDTSRVAFIL